MRKKNKIKLNNNTFEKNEGNSSIRNKIGHCVKMILFIRI